MLPSCRRRFSWGQRGPVRRARRPRTRRARGVVPAGVRTSPGRPWRCRASLPAGPADRRHRRAHLEAAAPRPAPEPAPDRTRPDRTAPTVDGRTLMARILAYTSPARGHLFPLTPILDELRRRGHRIALRTLASQVPLLRRRGFEAAPISDRVEAIQHDDWRAGNPRAALARAVRISTQRAEHDAAGGGCRRGIAAARKAPASRPSASQGARSNKAARRRQARPGGVRRRGRAACRSRRLREPPAGWEATAETTVLTGPGGLQQRPSYAEVAEDRATADVDHRPVLAGGGARRERALAEQGGAGVHHPRVVRHPQLDLAAERARVDGDHALSEDRVAQVEDDGAEHRLGLAARRDGPGALPAQFAEHRDGAAVRRPARPEDNGRQVAGQRLQLAEGLGRGAEGGRRRELVECAAHALD